MTQLATTHAQTFKNLLLKLHGISGRSGTGLVRLSLVLGLVSLLALVGCATSPDSGGDQKSKSQESIDSAAVAELEIENSDANGSESDKAVDSADHTQSGTDKAATINEHISSLPVAPEIGARAPDFELATVTGEQMTLSDVRGKPMFISFFHSW